MLTTWQVGYKFDFLLEFIQARFNKPNDEEDAIISQTRSTIAVHLSPVLENIITEYIFFTTHFKFELQALINQV
jgi:hypothetical protein